MESFLIKQCDNSPFLCRYGTWNLTCRVKDSLRVFGKRVVDKIIGGWIKLLKRCRVIWAKRVAGTADQMWIHLGTPESKKPLNVCLLIIYLILFVCSVNTLCVTEDSMGSSDWQRVTTYRKWFEKTRSLSNHPDTWLDRPSRTVCIPDEVRSRPLHASQYFCWATLLLDLSTYGVYKGKISSLAGWISILNHAGSQEE
jgi:hypothetical protein